MVVAHTITPEAYQAMLDADQTNFTFRQSRRVYDEWHLAFRSPLNMKERPHVSHVAFFELLDGTMIAQVIGEDKKLHVMLANS